MASSAITGAHIIAQTLKDLDVQTIFGLVGVPVSDIAEQAINRGIRFIGFRNEQAASYAATAYGYLTGKPGICLVVGGPGVLHALAGVGAFSPLNPPSAALYARLTHAMADFDKRSEMHRKITFRCYSSVDPSKPISSPRALFKSSTASHI